MYSVVLKKEPSPSTRSPALKSDFYGRRQRSAGVEVDVRRERQKKSASPDARMDLRRCPIDELRHDEEHDENQRRCNVERDEVTQ